MRERTGSFDRYKDEDIELTAFFHCNGCDITPDADRDLMEKLERVISMGTEAVHVGVCAYKDDVVMCDTVKRICDTLTEGRVDIIDGTHPTRKPLRRA
jgi:predicted metal-binding protein